jgi:branched-chain amino acid transport system permease protein
VSTQTAVLNARSLRLELQRRFGNTVAIVLVVLAAFVVGRAVFDRGIPYFFQMLVDGLTNGGIYALIALGYTMVYGIVELINFAHGDVFTAGGFIGLALMGMFGLSGSTTPGGALLIVLVLAIFAITMLVAGLMNVLIERVAYRPLRNAPRVAPLITAIGMSFVLEGLMYIFEGPSNVNYPDLLPDVNLSIGSVSIGSKQVIVIGTAILLTLALTAFINGSRLGKAMRATAQDRDASALMGIDINRTIAATFFIGAVLAAAGGIIYGLYFGTIRFDLGYQAGLYAFTAAVFGGIGNIYGAALGGLFIGVVQAFSDSYGSHEWTGIYIFGILILVLVFRPTGLLGMRVPEK